MIKILKEKEKKEKSDITLRTRTCVTGVDL